MAEKADAPTSSSTDTGSAPRGAADGAAVPKATIKNVDMSEEMQQESVDIASAALEKFNIEKDIAAHIKKEFDRKHGPTWHVVVGKNFGSYVTHGAYAPFTSCRTMLTACRNETFHLLLRRLPRDSYLEVIEDARQLDGRYAQRDTTLPSKFIRPSTYFILLSCCCLDRSLLDYDDHHGLYPSHPIFCGSCS